MKQTPAISALRHALALLLAITLPVAAQDAPDEKPQPPINGQMFQKLVPTLDKALDLVDRHESLPDKTLLFGEDKRSNTAKIQVLLDEAIDALQIAKASDLRNQIRLLQDQIRQAHRDLAKYRRQKVSAPLQQDQSLLDKANPFLITKEGYDALIEQEQANIKAWEQDLVELKRQFRRELEAIGLKVDDQAVESLLASISGDGFITMTVVFNNIKQVTTQLQQLTDDSGEALDVAKRYYGMYVVLVRAMDRIQKQFIADINEVHVPALEEYMKQAEQNIAQARKLIDTDGGDKQILLSNIESNATTYKTAELYITYLKQQAEMIDYENKQVEKNLATAMNTYQTVRLSSDVATLMKTGRENFEALMKLRLPYLREFQNEVIRKEFQRMTDDLRDRR